MLHSFNLLLHLLGSTSTCFKVLWRCYSGGGDRLGCGWKSSVIVVHRGDEMDDGRSIIHWVSVWSVSPSCDRAALSRVALLSLPS